MQKINHHIYSFEGFTLDLTRGCLLREDKEIKLRPQTFETLKFLVENSGRLISKDELIKAVWPDWDASDNQLARCLSELRHALDEDEQHYIKTVPRRGYIFDVQVDEKSTSATIYAEQVEGIHIVIDEVEDSNPPQLEKLVLRPGSRYLTPKIIQHKPALLIALTIMFGVVAFGLYRFIARDGSHSPTATFQSMKIARLTNSGKAVNAAISPDGKYVANVVDTDGQQSIWMRQVATASNVQIVPPAKIQYTGVTFSRDGNYLYYEAWGIEHSPIVLYQMPVLGGPPRKLIVNIDSVIAFSPDNTRFAFLRGNPAQSESELLVARVDGTAEQKIAVRTFPDAFSTQGDAPAWSPDGKTIACPAGSADAGGPYMTVLAVGVADGTSRPITPKRWWKVGSLAWLKDGHGLVFAASEQESSPSQLWYLSYPAGEEHRITNDVNNYDGLSLTADTRTLVTVQSNLLSSIWIGPSGDSNQSVQIPSNNFDGVEGIAWEPDGKLIFSSRAGGNSDIWSMNRDGTSQKRLTAAASNNSWPSVSADGRYIAFMSDRDGARHVWRMDSDGNNPQQLTNGGNEWYPDCSPVDRWVVYVNGLGKRRLWKVSIDGGESVQVNDKTSALPAISPDGKWVASTYFDHPERLKTAIYPFAGGDPIKIFDVWNFYKRWTPDGHALAYIDPHNSSEITIQPIEGGPPKLITNFKTGQIFRFAWSRDGQWLALVRGSVTNDVVTISDFE